MGAKLETDVDEAVQLCRDHQIKLEQEQERCRVMLIAKAELEATVVTLSHDCNEARNSAAVASEAARIADERDDQTTAALQKSQHAKGELADQVQSLKHSLDAANVELRTLQSAKAKLETDVEEAMQSCRDHQTKLEQEQERCRVAHDAQVELEASVATLSRSCNEARNSAAAAVEAARIADGQSTAALQRSQRAQAELQDQVQSLEHTRTELQARVAALTQTNVELQVNVAALTDMTQRAQSASFAADHMTSKRLEQSEADVTNLTERLAQALQENEALGERLRSMQQLQEQTMRGRVGAVQELQAASLRNSHQAEEMQLVLEQERDEAMLVRRRLVDVERELEQTVLQHQLEVQNLQVQLERVEQKPLRSARRKSVAGEANSQVQRDVASKHMLKPASDGQHFESATKPFCTTSGLMGGSVKRTSWGDVAKDRPTRRGSKLVCSKSVEAGTVGGA